MAPSEPVGDFVESLLRDATDAARTENWERARELVDDLLVLRPYHADGLALRRLIERHVRTGGSADRRHLTVVFADLVGSTPMSQRLDLEEFQQVNLLFEDACRPAVEQHGGHIVEFLGDGLVAYFGYPTAHEDDARRAVTAALDIQERLARVAEDAHERFGVSLASRIGIDSGEVVLSDRGAAGWTQRSAAFGPTMNRAARLQQEAAGSEVVVSGETHDLAAAHFDFTDLGWRTLKGIDDPVRAYRAEGFREPVAPSSVASHRSGTLVGRDPELAKLLRMWEQTLTTVAGEPDSSSILITGDAGIGKSRLVQELLVRTSDQAGAPLELQCTSYGERTTFYPVRLALERYAHLQPADDAAIRTEKLETLVVSVGVEPERAVPLLGLLLGVDIDERYPSLELAPRQLHESILNTLVELVVALGEAQPFVTLIEDVHWADPATLELIQRLIDARPRTLIAATARTRARSDVPLASMARMHLGQLNLEHTVELTRQLLPPSVASDLASQVSSRSDGVPLYVEQLARMIADDPERGHERIPRGLEELLQARLDIAGSAKRTAQLAAVVGRDFDVALLDDVGAVLETDFAVAATDAASDLLALEESGILETVSLEPTRMRFQHALLAERAYESILATDRRALHGAVGRSLLSHRDDDAEHDPAVVALHFERADMAADAVPQLLRASEVALGQGAFDAALGHLGRADSLLDAVDAEIRSPMELGVRLSRGLVTSSSQGYAAPAVVDDYSTALELCEKLEGQPGIGTDVVKALFGIWTYYAASGDLDGCTRAEEMLDRELDLVPYPGGRPALEAARGVHLFYLGQFDEACSVLTDAIEGLERDEIDPRLWHLPNDPMVAAGAFLMLGRFFQGDEAGAQELGSRMRARAETLAFPQGPFSLAFLRNFEMRLERCRGQVDEAIRRAEELQALGTKHGFVDWQLVGAMNVPLCRSMTAPTVEHCRQIGEAVDLFQSLGAIVLVNEVMAGLSNLYVALGRLDEAERHLSEAIALAERGQLAAQAEIQLAQARFSGAAGEGDEAVHSHIEAAFETTIAQGAVFYLLRCAHVASELAPELDLSCYRPHIEHAVGAFGEESRVPEVVAARAAYG